MLLIIDSDLDIQSLGIHIYIYFTREFPFGLNYDKHIIFMELMRIITLFQALKYAKRTKEFTLYDAFGWLVGGRRFA